MAFNFKTKLNSKKTNYNMYFTGCLLFNYDFISLVGNKFNNIFFEIIH